MKKIVYGLILAFGMSMSANAFSAWCRAASPVAWGEGRHYNVEQACRIALIQCASRTSSGYTCVVVDFGH